MASANVVTILPRGAVINFSIIQGESYKLPLRWKTSEFAVVDVTSYTASMIVRTTAEGPALLTLTNTAGIALGGHLGTISATLTAAQSAALPAQKLIYTLMLTAPDGTTVTAIARGQITIIRNRL